MDGEDGDLELRSLREGGVGPLPNWLFMIAAVVVVAAFLVFLVTSVSTGLIFAPEKKIGIIEVRGELFTGEESQFGTTTGELQRSLEKALRDQKIKAVVLKVDSPGGTATACYEMYSMAKRLEKPSVAFIRGVGASGSYLLSLGTDKVVAHPFSEVGSVGVFIQLLKPIPPEPENVEGIDIISSGKFKTLWEDGVLDENEREYLRSKVEELEETFRDIVYEEAPIERIEVDENFEENIENSVYVFLEGGWFSGRKAFEIGLFDELGDMEDSIRIASELAGIKREEAGVVEIEPPEPGTFKDTFYGSSLYRDNERPVVFLKAP